MKQIKQVNEAQFWQIIGLLALAKEANKQLKYIEEAIGDTLGVDISDIAGNSGHISDAIHGQEYNVEELLRKMDIGMP